MAAKIHWKAFFIILGLVVAAHAAWYYRGLYVAPETQVHDLDLDIFMEPVGSFTEELAVKPGTVLLDLSHENNISKVRLGLLYSGIVARGHAIEIVSDENALAGKLSYANALIVAAPGKPYTKEEVDDIHRFSERGGRVLLLDEMNSGSSINSLATRFSVYFRPDYIFDTENNDGNFRFVKYRSFASSAVTDGLKEIVLFGACSLDSPERGIVFAARGAASNYLESPVPLSPVALHGEMLAVCDTTVFEGRFSDAVENRAFISRVAAWLTSAQRQYGLADFPHFFENEAVSIVSTPKFLRLAAAFRGLLERNSLDAKIESAGSSNAVAVLQDFDGALLVEEAGLLLVREPDGKTVNLNGYALDRKNGAALALKKEGNATLLMLFADDEDRMQTIITHMNEGRLDAFMVSDDLAIFIPKKEDGDVT